MERDERIEEPAVDRFSAQSAPEGPPAEHGALELPDFKLTGGIMRAGARTSNRIDGLLTRLMREPPCRYLHDTDKNLEYLHTSLQLDLINSFAEQILSRAVKAERPSGMQTVGEDMVGVAPREIEDTGQ